MNEIFQKTTEIKKKKGNDKDYFSLNNLKIFISVLNLFNERYSHFISREFAQDRIIKDDEATKIEKAAAEYTWGSICNIVLFIHVLANLSPIILS